MTIATLSLETALNTSRPCLMVITGAFQATGGIAAVNRLVAATLAQEGFSITIFSLNEATNAAPDERYVDPSRVTYRAFEGDKIAFTLAIWRTLLQTRYAFIFVDHVNLAAVLAPLSTLRLCRYTLWLHGTEVWPPAPTLEGKIGLMGAGQCLTGSAMTRDKVLARYANVPITLCEPCLDPVEHDLTRSAEPAPDAPLCLQAVDGVKRPPGSRVILHVARMAANEQQKGQDTLIRSMADILAEFADAQLVLAGAGDDMPRLLALAQEQTPAVQAAIFMPGFVPAPLLRQLYRTCYLYAMPSRGEGFGIVFLEAMSHAKACVGSASDAGRYLIADGQTGFVVDDPTSPGEVACKIRSLLSNPAEATRMGQKAASVVQQNYLFPHFKSRFMNAIQGGRLS